MTVFSQSQRFDSGCQSSTRLNPQSVVSFVKGNIVDDPFSVKPVRGAEKINEETELDIRAIGSTDFGIIGVGNSLSNWLDKSIARRYKVEYSGYTFFHKYIDLSQMPTSFWDDVRAGGNIIISNEGSYLNIEARVLEIDTVEETGIIVCDGGSTVYVYVSQSINTNTYATAIGTTASYYMPLEEGIVGDLAGNSLTFQSTPTVFADGAIGDGIKDLWEVDHWSNSGDDGTLGFYFSTTATAPVNLVDIGSDCTVALDASGRVEVTLDTGAGSPTTHTFTGATGLNDGNKHAVFLMVDVGAGQLDVYVDGAFQTFAVGTTGNWQNNFSDEVYFYADSTTMIDEVIWDLQDNSFNSAYATTHYQLMLDNSYGQAVTEELFIEITPTYSNTAQLYTYNTVTNTWDGSVNGEVIKTTKYPEYGPVFSMGNLYLYFPLANSASSSSIYYMALYDFRFGGGLNESKVLETVSTRQKHRALYQGAIDRYYTSDAKVLNEYNNTTVTETVFSAGDIIEDFDTYSDYIEIATQKKGNAVNGVWDRVIANFQNVSVLGIGEPKVLHVFDTGSFQVIDGYIGDITDGYMAVRYASGGKYKTLVKLDAQDSGFAFEAKYRGRTASFNAPVAPHKARTQEGVVFWATVTIEGIERTGLWQLGKNVVSDIVSLAYLIDLNAEPVEIIEHNGDIYVLDVDGNFWGQSSTLATTEVITQKITAGDSSQKKLYNTIRIGVEPLITGQSVTVYYKNANQSTYTQIGNPLTVANDNSGKSEVSTFVVSHNADTSSVQYRIVGTGGVTITSVKVEGDVLQN